MSGESFEICIGWVRPRFSQLLKVASPFLQQRSHSYCSHAFLLSAVAISASFLAGCGSVMSTQNPPPPPGPTSITVLLSSSGNDRLSKFAMVITSIALTSKSGSQVSLYGNSNDFVDFIHLNGISEPLATVSIPQGVYTSANLTVGYCDFTVGPALDSSTNELVSSTYAQGLCGQGTGNTTVSLDNPISVSGPTMGLQFDLQVSRSYTLNGTGTSATYTISPVFNLTAIAISSQPTNDQNGKESGIQGRIASLDAFGSSFNLSVPDGVTLTIHTSGSTAFQGISAFANLAAGMFVDMDAAIQSDGSLLATRIAVADPTARDADFGPVAQMASSNNFFGIFERQRQGDDFIGNNVIGCCGQYQFASSTTFRTSGEFTNLQSLPFLASFNNSTLALGQNIYVSSSSISFTGGTYSQATTITLMPQTVDGTVVAASSSGNFQVYTVALAQNDFLNTLNGTASIVVYVDSNTQMLATAPLSPGAVFRFNGLLFNDNGTLRMDCGQINDGVPE
jgi:Domain of unknown function (DUF5666)